MNPGIFSAQLLDTSMEAVRRLLNCCTCSASVPAAAWSVGQYWKANPREQRYLSPVGLTAAFANRLLQDCQCLLFSGGLSLTARAHSHCDRQQKVLEISILPGEPQSVGWWINNQAVYPLGRVTTVQCRFYTVSYSLPLGPSVSRPHGVLCDAALCFACFSYKF